MTSPSSENGRTAVADPEIGVGGGRAPPYTPKSKICNLKICAKKENSFKRIGQFNLKL